MTKKFHYFKDCTGFYYSEKKEVLFTSEIHGITCGQCKGRILNAIKNLDWSNLSVAAEEFLRNPRSLIVEDP